MLKFEKYHGLGNDFLIFHERDLKEFKDENGEYFAINERDYSKFVKLVSHRNLGLGADGVIILRELSKSKVEMMFFNQDGTIASMCGNGIRCFSHFIHRNGILDGDSYEIKTLAGIMKINIFTEDGVRVRVNMGKPKFNIKDIPLDEETFEFWYGKRKEAIDYPSYITARDYQISSVFMGTTHTVTYINNLENKKVKNIGKQIENYEIFPQGTNVNFVQILDRNNVKIKTWEKGVGLTLACGTGACATVAVGNLKMKNLDNNVTVHYPKGKLFIEVADNKNIYMTGPSIFVAEGLYNIKSTNIKLKKVTLSNKKGV